MTPQERAKSILPLLKKAYPEHKTGLKHHDAFQLLVAVILSAQCTDERVNIVTKELFRQLKTPKDFADVPLPKLEKLIYSTGFYKNKAKNIKATAAKVYHDFNNKVPSSMEDLLTLPGVARKTANVVQQQYFGKVEGVVVDTHVGRLSQRLGLTKNKDPKNIEQDLMKVLPKKDWMLLADTLIWHGRRICFARKPNCAGCVLNKLCPSAFKV